MTPRAPATIRSSCGCASTMSRSCKRSGVLTRGHDATDRFGDTVFVTAPDLRGQRGRDERLCGDTARANRGGRLPESSSGRRRSPAMLSTWSPASASSRTTRTARRIAEVHRRRACRCGPRRSMLSWCSSWARRPSRTASCSSRQTSSTRSMPPAWRGVREARRTVDRCGPHRAHQERLRPLPRDSFTSLPAPLPAPISKRSTRWNDRLFGKSEDVRTTVGLQRPLFAQWAAVDCRRSCLCARERPRSGFPPVFSTDSSLQFDAAGIQNCSSRGVPRSCGPLTVTDASGPEGSPPIPRGPVAIAHGIAYVVNSGLRGFAATDEPTLLWTSGAVGVGDAGSSGTVANGVVYALGLRAMALSSGRFHSRTTPLARSAAPAHPRCVRRCGLARPVPIATFFKQSTVSRSVPASRTEPSTSAPTDYAPTPCRRTPTHAERLRVQGFIATLRRVLVMVSSSRVFVEGVR